jgi:hypothetical protein
MKWVIRLWVIGLVGLVGFAVAATVLPSPRPGPQAPVSHEVLEADRIMTQQMGTYVGPGMEAVMSANGMLDRSADQAYLRALEWHAYEIDRMIGRAP